MKFNCCKCKKEKDSSLFSKKTDSKRGFSYKCKDCHNTYVREIWYPKNKEKQISSSSNWKKRNKAKVLATTYKSTEEIMQKLLNESDGKCKICKEIKPLVLDHCHDTGAIRGLLCRNCNIGLGLFNDNKEALQNAIDYL